MKILSLAATLAVVSVCALVTVAKLPSAAFLPIKPKPILGPSYLPWSPERKRKRSKGKCRPQF